ncbi:MAG: hypothetical protein RSP_14000 [Rhodanobacter sp.]
MKPGACRLGLIGLLAAMPVAQAWPAIKTAQQAAAAVARQQAVVDRLRKNVKAQESDSQAAAAKLKRQDAEIAALQRQLQAVQRSEKAAAAGP